MPTIYDFLAAVFLFLVLETAIILYREAKRLRPSPSAVLALVLVWIVALALRLLLSPHTFLHEYYHIAETVPGYLTGNIAPQYGSGGPALFRLAGAVLGPGDDVRVIFLTNAVIASLAIPALALLDLALMGSWPRALCAAVLLCVLPLHLRFSAAEDLFVQAVTFGLWALALFALYLRTRSLDHALAAAVALSLAMQMRPEMLLFPAVLVALVVVVEPQAWRVFFARRSLIAFVVLGALLIPRVFELQHVLHDGGSPVPSLPELSRYLSRLVLFQPQVTPPVYWALLIVGAAWTASRAPRLLLWVILVFVGYTLFSLSLFDNSIYHLRSQLLPVTFVVLIAAGAASAWMELWGQRRGLAVGIGASVLAVLAVVVAMTSRGFITELRDQQLEWAFLERTVPQLPQQATLLSAVEVGGRNLDAFPTFLLSRAGKSYRTVDVRRAAKGEIAWPAPGEDLLYYQGMFCHFAFDPEEPALAPLTAPCMAVHERYTAEPLFVEDLDSEFYSQLPHNAGPYRIGFYRLKAAHGAR